MGSKLVRAVLPSMCAVAVLSGVGMNVAHATGRRAIEVSHPRFHVVVREAPPEVWTSGPYALVTRGSNYSRSVVISDLTGRRTNFANGTCIHAAIGAPWVLFDCGGGNGTDGLGLYNMQTGKWRYVQCNSSACADVLQETVGYRVGARWVEFVEEGRQSCGDGEHFTCGPQATVFYNIRTHRLRYSWHQSTTTILDLDVPSLVRQVCAPLKAPVTFYGSFAITYEPTGPGRLGTYLERCGSRLNMPIDQPNGAGLAGSLAGNAHAILWEVLDYTGAWHGQLKGVLLPSLRPFTLSLPREIPSCGVSPGSGSPYPLCDSSLALSAGTLYVTDAQYRVWAAPFPPISRLPRR